MSDARVTSLYAEVLVTEAADARVTSLYSEILVTEAADGRVTSLFSEVLTIVGSKVNFTEQPLSLTGVTFDIDAELAFITEALVLTPGKVLDPSSVAFNESQLVLSGFTFFFPEDIPFTTKTLLFTGQTFQAIEINGKVFSAGSIVVNGIDFETKLSFGSATSKFLLDF